MPQKTFFPDLDGLRFVAFFMVFMMHAVECLTLEQGEFSWLQAFTRHGFLGIEFFFVLSSFLLTYIGLEEYQNKKSFSAKNFLIRRSLRIWPLYFFILLIGFVLAPVAFDVLLPPVGYFLSFAGNLYMHYHNAEFLIFITFLWTICIEEQFYLIWALVLKLLSRNLYSVAMFLIAIGIGFKLLSTESSTYFHTLTYLPDFAIGAILANSSFRKDKLFQLLKSQLSNTWVLIYATLLFWYLYYTHITSLNSYIDSVAQTITGLLFGLVIFDQCFNDRQWLKLRQINILAWLGKRSYGLYIWHGVVLTIFVKLLGLYSDTSQTLLILSPIFNLVLTILLATLSYSLLEGPFLKLKARFQG